MTTIKTDVDVVSVIEYPALPRSHGVAPKIAALARPRQTRRSVVSINVLTLNNVVGPRGPHIFGDPVEGHGQRRTPRSSSGIPSFHLIGCNLKVWFLQAESQFHLSGVTSQEIKYHHVVSALSLAAADELFIQRLPTNVQMVLATATALGLTGLAALADAVIEVATPPVDSVTSAAEESSEAMPALPGTPSTDGNLEQLCQRLEQSVTAATHRRDRPRTQQQQMLTVLAPQVQRTSAYTIAALAPTPGTAFVRAPGANR
ncbi:hypothetical protein HPB47_006284 [Ixodes persulcatus]|uniref:Uncharacterized protein n=1 Tax=Ixodes persulcatus TaxID=34615 RepID=A0AC60PAR8_IXOPE|nr:hypothetical protein HPB47_006284 [Ixodes persulcatus]